MGVRRSRKLRVFERDGYSCRYCGFDMTLHFAYPHLGVLTVDHMVAKAAGGSDHIDNLVTCCSPCNRRKRNLRVEEFVDEKTMEALNEIRGLGRPARESAS